MLKVGNQTKFKRKAFGDFFVIRKKLVSCKKDRETLSDIIFYIFDK